MVTPRRKIEGLPLRQRGTTTAAAGSDRVGRVTNRIGHLNI